jgi:hypothetical protein
MFPLVELAIASSAFWESAWLVIGVVSGRLVILDTVRAICALDNWSRGLGTKDPVLIGLEFKTPLSVVEF